MRYLKSLLCVSALALAVSPAIQARPGAQEGPSTSIAGGGIHVPGWMGKVDANEAKAGLSVNSAKFVAEGANIHVTTGPATTYWNPANKASGDYTVKATFTESDFMGLNDHAHPYGIMIGGNDLGTDNQSYIYCSAYGNGTFIVRGMGPAPFKVSASRATANEAVHKAEAQHKPVTQEIAMQVKGDSISCIINGTTVGTYPKSEVIGEGKLKSTDGVYGIRFAHNTDGVVSGLTVVK